MSTAIELRPRLDFTCRRGRLVTPLLAVLSLHALTSSPATAAGETPDNPRNLPIGTAANASLSSGNSEAWFLVTYQPPSTATDFSITTQGKVDTCLDLYHNLDNALEDVPFVSDDDSGKGSNARLVQPFGFPPPLYLRLSRCGGGATGNVKIVTAHQRKPAVKCPYPSTCVFAELLDGTPASLEYLRDLRRVSEVLPATAHGRHVAALYWQVSSELMVKAAFDSAIRSDLLSHLAAFRPVIANLLDSASPSILVTPELIHASEQALATLRPHLSPATATRLNRAVARLSLAEHVDRPLREHLVAMGLALAETDPRLALAATARIIVKTAPSIASEVAVVGTRLRLGDSALDAALSHYRVRSFRRVFKTGAGSAGLQNVYSIDLEDARLATELVATLRRQEAVVYAERDGLLFALGDVFYSAQYALRPSSVSRGGINAVTAWNTTTGIPEIRVAVVDTGVEYQHADLAGHIRTDLGYDFADDDPDSSDDHGHGTHVAGTIAASLNNGYSVAGVAPRITLIPIRVLGANGSGTAESIAGGIEAAVLAGARVINLSLGGPSSFQVIEDAVRFAAENEVLVVAAAGNEGTAGLLFPARSEHCLAISAVDATGRRAKFSSYGEGLFMAAPGVDIVSTFRDGSSCLSSGTSMATPHVVGVAALVLSKNPSLTRDDLIRILSETARDVGPAGWDAEYGWGIVDAARAVQR